VEVRDGQTKSRGGLESSRWCVHSNSRRSERVVWWEDEGTPVLTVVVWGLLRAGYYVVPFQNVVLGWVGNDVWWRIRLDSLVLAGETLGRCLCRHILLSVLLYA